MNKNLKRDSNGRFIKGEHYNLKYQRHLISCACGCGMMIPDRDKKARPMRFMANHRNWKGDSVGYKGLHKWIRKHFPPPEKCDGCNDIKQVDLANITGVYNRELKNWRYLCRKCHSAFDDILTKAWITRKRMYLRTSGDLNEL